MGQCVNIRKNIRLIVHHDVRRARECAIREGPASLAFIFVTITPPTTLQTMSQSGCVFRTQRMQGFHHLLNGPIPRDIGLDVFDHWDIGVVVVNFVQLKHTTAKLKVAEKGIQIPSDGGYQIIIDGHWNIIREESCLASRRVIPSAGVKNIRSHRASQTRGQCEFVVFEFGVKLVEGRLSDLWIPLLEEGGKRTLGQLALIALGILEFSKLHIDIRELRKSLTMSTDRG